MKNRWNSLNSYPLILALATLLTPLTVQAQNQLSLGQLEPGQIALNLNLTEQRRVEQDTLNATLEYMVQGRNRVELQDEVNKAMGMTLELLRGTTGIEFSTGRYQVSIVPADRPARGDIENPVWRARQGIQLSSLDSEALLAVTGQLQQAGLALNGLYYSLSPALHESISAELLQSALSKLQGRAEAAASTTLSSATTYRLTLDGVTEYIALIIAPGEALSTQDRSSAPLNYSSYLDGQNGGSGYDFFTSYAANPDLFNDRVIGITLDEYMKYVGISAVREMKSVLDADHGGGSYVSGPSTPDATNIDVTGSQTSFRTLFNSEADWLQQSTTSGVSSDNERWTRWSVYITPALDTSLGGDSFSIKFRGCDMVFSAAFGSDAITRAGYAGTGDSC